MPKLPIIIVGAGMAGFAVARELKQLGNTQEVLMLTADDGAFYSKPLLSLGQSRQKSASSLKIPAEKAGISNGVTILPNTTVAQVDVMRKIVYTEDGRSFEYEKLVVATGAKPLALWSGARVFSVNSAQDMSNLEPALTAAQRVLIAGAGFVGLEFANDWVKAGKAVTVISRDGPLNPLVPEQVSQWIEDRLTAAGVRFVRGALNPGITSDGVFVELSNGGEPEQFDLLLSAVGLAANAGIWDKAGIITSRNGVRVNERFETSAEHIYALGDAIEYLGKHWRYLAPLNHAAKVIAANIMGANQTENFGVLSIALKCPNAPLTMVLPEPTASGTWAFTTREGLFEATFRDSEVLRGYILESATAGRRKELDAEIKAA